MNTFLTGLLIGAVGGLIVGFVVAVKVGAGGTTNENHIGKIKTTGDASPVDADFKMPEVVTEKTKKRGFFRKIFTKKSKL